MKEKFEFSKKNTVKVNEILKKYPKGKERSAVMDLLWLAQEQNDNWISQNAMEHIAEVLNIPAMQVYEVANFYTMYNKKPVGKNLIQVCRTTPCWLRKSNDIVNTCKKELNIDIGETTSDGMFTLVEVECLGACTTAPVAQINDDYHENLTKEKIIQIIDSLRARTIKN